MYRRVGKRLFDMAVSVVALVVLSPILLIAAAAVKLHDGGPILFIQHRVGRKGALFPFFKLRSMPVDTPRVVSSNAATLTVTPVGRVIRRTSIDELPQLVNIAVGHMSIVGPRPPLPTQTELLELRKESGALNLRPGLTGLAQVNAYDEMSVGEKASWDAAYVTTLSLQTDLSIIARTFQYLRKPPPRY